MSAFGGGYGGGYGGVVFVNFFFHFILNLFWLTGEPMQNF